MNARKTKSPPQDDPNELPYPGHAREVATMQEKTAAAARMRGEPLPGALREAFAGEPRRMHGFTFQPVNAWLIAILRRIKSPILDMMKIWHAHSEELAEAEKVAGQREREAALTKLLKQINDEAEALDPSADSIMETVFAFLTDVEVCQELLDDPAPKKFIKSARLVLGRLHPVKLGDLERACGEHFMLSFTTALSLSAVQKDDPNETVFTPPPAMMASAGGSKSSVP